MNQQKRLRLAEVAGASVELANDLPIVLVGGVNVLESLEFSMAVADHLKEVCAELGLPLIFKASFDKANRSSYQSFRGPGLDKGLEWLAEIKQSFGLPILTDIHEPAQAAPVAEVADILQIPAFLCRQTDLIRAACETGRPINIKKGQFIAPDSVGPMVKKCEDLGNDQVILCERGSSFGYHNLVVDFLGFPLMKRTGCPIMFDVTHSLQQPGGLGHATAGRREFLRGLALAGVAQSIASLFVEFHTEPDRALCDGPCAWPLELAEPLLRQVVELDRLVKSLPPLLES